MAKTTQTIVTLTDDLDGGKADRTISFSYDGTSYEIDLSKRNANAFDKAFATYIGAVREVPETHSRARPVASNGKTKQRSDLADIVRVPRPPAMT